MATTTRRDETREKEAAMRAGLVDLRRKPEEQNPHELVCHLKTHFGRSDRSSNAHTNQFNGSRPPPRQELGNRAKRLIFISIHVATRSLHGSVRGNLPPPEKLTINGVVKRSSFGRKMTRVIKVVSILLIGGNLEVRRSS